MMSPASRELLKQQRNDFRNVGPRFISAHVYPGDKPWDSEKVG
jgi:hypothetical protein